MLLSLAGVVSIGKLPPQIDDGYYYLRLCRKSLEVFCKNRSKRPRIISMGIYVIESVGKIEFSQGAA
jgi:hypothetical protein